MSAKDQVADALERTVKPLQAQVGRDLARATAQYYGALHSVVDPVIEQDGGVKLFLIGSVFQNGGSQRRPGLIAVTPKTVLTAWQQGVFSKKSLTEAIAIDAITSANVAPHTNGAKTRLLTVESTTGVRIQFLLPQGSQGEGLLAQNFLEELGQKK